MLRLLTLISLMLLSVSIACAQQTILCGPTALNGAPHCAAIAGGVQCGDGLRLLDKYPNLLAACNAATCEGGEHAEECTNEAVGCAACNQQTPTPQPPSKP